MACAAKRSRQEHRRRALPSLGSTWRASAGRGGGKPNAAPDAFTPPASRLLAVKQLDDACAAEIQVADAGVHLGQCLSDGGGDGRAHVDRAAVDAGQ